MAKVAAAPETLTKVLSVFVNLLEKMTAGGAKADEVTMETRQFKKIEIAKPKVAPGGCTPGVAADPDAPPC